MNWLILTGAALCGYVFGSVSFGRIIARIAAPEKHLQTIRYPIPGSDKEFTSDKASATAVRAQLGPRYGCLTALLDMAKVAVPVLLVKLLFPSWPYYAVTAATGVLGHDWPLYHRFKGGGGESPILGGLLVLDPLGIPALLVSGSILGLIVGHILVFRWAWVVLLVPWFWLRHHSWLFLGYALLCNLAYWIALRPELRKFSELKDQPSQEQLSVFFGLGSAIGRWMDRYSLFALLRRVSAILKARKHSHKAGGGGS